MFGWVLLNYTLKLSPLKTCICQLPTWLDVSKDINWSHFILRDCNYLFLTYTNCYFLLDLNLNLECLVLTNTKNWHTEILSQSLFSFPQKFLQCQAFLQRLQCWICLALSSSFTVGLVRNRSWRQKNPWPFGWRIFLHVHWSFSIILFLASFPDICSGLFPSKGVLDLSPPIEFVYAE